MFDLAKTQALADLFAIARADRDAEWTSQFMDAAWNASLVVNDPPVFEAPDGFAYLRLNLPPPRVPFPSNAMANVATSCVRHATGIALFSSAGDPVTASQYVFPMGMIDSLLRFDTWRGDPQDREERGEQPSSPSPVMLEEDHEVLLGSPSSEFLPPHAARALLAHLREGWGIEEPRVQLLLDRRLRPTRNLVLGHKLSAFQPGVPVDAVCQRLMWYLPPGRALMLMPEDWEQDDMTRLADLCGEASDFAAT